MTDLRRDREAPADHDIHELLRRRWSPRAFDASPVDRGTLLRLFEAARWGPSSFNEQPWRYLVALKGEAADFERMLQCLTAGNQTWARQAPVLVISAASLAFARNQKPNRHAFHDVGLATENLVIQATSLGLVVHQMAGFDVVRTRETYRVPEGFEPVAAMAIGYPGSPEQLEEPYRSRELAPRTRRPLSGTVFGGVWGESF